MNIVIDMIENYVGLLLPAGYTVTPEAKEMSNEMYKVVPS